MAECRIEGCDGKSRTKGLCNKHALRLRQTGTTDPGPKAEATVEVRFWRRVEKTDGCWWWIPAKSANKYGLIQLGGVGSKSVTTHRFSYELHNGEIPEGMIVMHSCDNPSCVNPDHLSLGTHKDNVADMIAKGRRGDPKVVGVDHPKAVLNEHKVRYIRANPSKSHAQLARELGVGANTVRGVRTGRTWSHVK